MLRLPLPQTPQFARACARIGVQTRLCKREAREGVRLLWQVQSRVILPFGRVDLVSRGPVAEDPGELCDWVTRWPHWHDGRPLLLNADGIPPSILRDGGFWPLMTPATIALLPLATPPTLRASLRQKWRNRLNRAQREEIEVRHTDLTPDHWLLGTEARHAKTKGYKGLPPAFCAIYAAANPGEAVVYEARHKGQPVAAALILRHGRMATWQIGHSTEEGRRLNAMNLVLWEAATDCWRRGHDMLDLGILNAQDAPGLTRFKLGLGATAHRLGGTWVHLPCLAPVARVLPLAFCS